ncbi:hypothetical protein R1T16_01130 [Flavobacterium sp. DG1-102-2]|uniref:hypothetical protein n=1 Tax=Flavobacterium sp. DG1-102-2 TaxID=3081663 RepID=UPI00294919C0|nr:hypothetical protein [Flavobacterium sp. DG1-102-2]MDV6167006.1 hypothetical protein [Flavobacterium sp. DG1-102-2]
MKKFKTIGLVAIVTISTCIYSCKEKSSNNDESYGPTETSRSETPTENDEATNDTSAHETGPGSATIGDTLNKTSN